MGRNKNKNQKIFFFTAVLAVLLVLPAGKIGASSITPEKVIDLVNAERAAQNLPDLALNGALAKAAENKVEDMIKNNYFAHTSPAGLTPWHWLEKNNYDYKYAGENLAMNFVNAESQDKAWMESQTHRDNILNQHYQEIGVAVAQGIIGGRATMVTVQEFGSRVEVIPAQPKQAETPKPETSPAPQTDNGKPRVLAENSAPGRGRYADAINKLAQSGPGTFTGAVTLALIGYLTVLNFIILSYLAVESKRKVSQGGKYQVLYTVSAEEYEDLMRSFKARARGIYKAHFGKMHIKTSS